MRLLEDHELVAVGGAGVDTYTFNLAPGVVVSTQLEANHTTTINVSNGSGPGISWNSGEFITCTVLSAGTGLLVGVYSGGNVPLGVLVDTLVQSGCSYAFSHTDEDGDEFF